MLTNEPYCKVLNPYFKQLYLACTKNNRNRMELKWIILIKYKFVN